MLKKFKKYLVPFVKYGFYLFVFLLPWQTKIILRPAPSNFNEISLYLSHFLLLLILIGFFIYKLRDKKPDEEISSLWLALVGLELGVLFSFFFASDQWLAFYFYVLFLAGIGLFYLLREGGAAAGYDNPFLDKFTIIYSFFAGLFFQAGLAVYQFLSQRAPANKYLGLAAHDPGTLGTAVIETASGRWLRAYGGLDHPNILGGVLALALIVAAYLLASRKVIRRKSEIVESLALFVFYFVALFALFFTFSRAAWLALLVGWAVLLVVLVLKKDSWILGRFLVLMFFSAVMTLIVAIPYQDLLQVRVDVVGRLEQKSLTERVIYLSEARQIWSQNWWTGAGVGNYVLALGRRDTDQPAAGDHQPVANVFLFLGAESGIFTLLFFLSFLVLLITQNRREVFAPALFTALLILMAFDHWLLSLPFGLIFLFLMLGWL
jgi:O-antigen ligase